MRRYALLCLCLLPAATAAAGPGGAGWAVGWHIRDMLLQAGDWELDYPARSLALRLETGGRWDLTATVGFGRTTTDVTGLVTTTRNGDDPVVTGNSLEIYQRSVTAGLWLGRLLWREETLRFWLELGCLRTWWDETRAQWREYEDYSVENRRAVQGRDWELLTGFRPEWHVGQHLRIGFRFGWIRRFWQGSRESLSASDSDNLTTRWSRSDWSGSGWRRYGWFGEQSLEILYRF